MRVGHTKWSEAFKCAHSLAKLSGYKFFVWQNRINGLWVLTNSGKMVKHIEEYKRVTNDS